jgi:hypothetical protein
MHFCAGSFYYVYSQMRILIQSERQIRPVQDRRCLPFKTGNICRSGSASRLVSDGQIELIEVRLTKSPLLDLKQVSTFKFLELGPHAALRCAHIVGERHLSWKAGIIPMRISTA